MSQRRVIECGAAKIELVEQAGGIFAGIGSVSVGGVALRSGARPITVRVDTPQGVLYTRLELAGVEPQTGGGTRVRLKAFGLPWGRAEYGDDYDQATVTLEQSFEPVEDEVTLVLAPAKLDLGGFAWEGFSYAWSFRSPRRQIHRMLELATWELGGSIVGNTVLSQGQCNRPVYRGAVDTLFTTACLRTLDLYGSPQANSFQLGPRAGLLQGFDFQYGPAGALLQFWPRLASISSLVESPVASDLLHVVDEYRFALSSDVATPAKVVLFAKAPAGGMAEHEARDLWLEAKEHVYGLSRARFGLTVARAVPEIAMRYATRPVDGRVRINIAGVVEVDSTEAPYAIAEHLLPRLAAQGVKRFFPEVMSFSDVTEVAMRRKIDDGVHGDLHCASVCATHRYFPADFWGGIKGWRAMYDKARALGIELGAWFSPHFSPRTPIFERHPEYRMVSVTGLPAGGGYGFQTLVVGDWNTGLYDEVLTDMRRWKEEGGLDYLFIDSLSNMGLLQANYAAAMRTNFEPLGRLFGEFQKMGIAALSCECVSAWMLGRFGVADLRGDLLAQDRSVAGQNDFGWWVDAQDMAGDMTLFAAVRKREPAELERLLFRHLAHRGCLTYENQYGITHELPAWWARLNGVYLRALPQMVRRRLLPGRAGVAWSDGAGRLVWTFAPVEVRSDRGGAIACETLEGSPAKASGAGAVSLPAWSVTRLQGGGTLTARSGDAQIRLA